MHILHSWRRVKNWHSSTITYPRGVPILLAFGRECAVCGKRVIVEDEIEHATPAEMEEITKWLKPTNSGGL